MKAALAFSAALVASAAAHADCSAMAARIMARTHATQLDVTPEFHNVRMAHDAAHEFTLVCGDRPTVEIAADDVPGLRYFALAAAAGGAAFGASEAGLMTTLPACLAAAAIDPSGERDIDAAGLRIECTAHSDSRDYMITIEPRR